VTRRPLVGNQEVGRDFEMAKMLSQLLVRVKQGCPDGPVAIERRLSLRGAGQVGRRNDRWLALSEQIQPRVDLRMKLSRRASSDELVGSNSVGRITNHQVANPPFTCAQGVGAQGERRRACGRRWLLVDQAVAEPINDAQHPSKRTPNKDLEIIDRDCHGVDGSFTAVTTPPNTPDERTPADVAGIFDLQSHGPDVWVGESPDYPWGRIFGGLVIAQALWTASQTVAQEHVLHSMHSYFILGGDPSEPVRYEVDRLRNGRSFTTRRVVARQSSGAIFNLSCSFQRHEQGVETQTADFPVDVPDPSTVDFHREGAGVDRFDVPLDGEPRSLTWVRFPHPLGDDPRLHLCALAYLSDSNAMDAIAHAHPNGMPPDHSSWDDTYMSASLDHAMWFHRPVNANDWLLFDMDGHGILRTRGLATGRVFNADGQHLATIAQEGLIRQVS